MQGIESFLLAPVFFAVSGGRAEHIPFENLRVIAGTGETDPDCDLCNGEIVVLQKGKALFDAVAQKKIKGRLVQRLLEQTAKFAFAGVAGGGNLIEGDIAGIIFVDKGKRILQPLNLSCLRRAVEYVMAHEECQKEDPAFDAWCDRVIAAMEQAKNMLRKAVD